MKRQNPGQLVVKFKLLVMKKKNKRFHTSMYVVCQIERCIISNDIYQVHYVTLTLFLLVSQSNVKISFLIF